MSPTPRSRLTIVSLAAAVVIALTIAWFAQHDEPQAKPDAAFSAFIAGNPAFDCADGRNNGKDPSNSFSFTPCPNGAAHLKLEKEKLTIIGASAPISLQGRTENSVDAPSGDVPFNFALREYTATNHNDDGTFTTATSYSVWTANRAHTLPFLVFVRETGGAWRVMVDPDNEVLDSKKSYELLYTWVDFYLPKVAVEVPINWVCAPNYKYGDWRC